MKHWCFCALVQGLSHWSSTQIRPQQLQPAPETAAGEITILLQKVLQTEVSVFLCGDKNTLYLFCTPESHSKHKERGELVGSAWNVLKGKVTVQNKRKESSGLLMWYPSAWGACECSWPHTSPSTRCLHSPRPCMRTSTMISVGSLHSSEQVYYMD